jgi:hypothetical protein
MAPVVIMLSTSFVAVPDLRRVDPVTTSGPTTGTMARSMSRPSSSAGGEFATSAVLAPMIRACAMAPRT